MENVSEKSLCWNIKNDNIDKDEKFDEKCRKEN
jgi:hypothetical protein